MKYDWKHIKDLRKASIFDLTDDIEVVRDCTGNPYITIDQKEEYEKCLGEWERVVTFCKLYRENYNEDFFNALKKSFPDVFKEHPVLPNDIYWE
ncbi:MAG: hypothetical protein IJQ94_01325 [Bacteroidales bacterium]|nr:hypothetical protein [Bacteroidales bacterium]